jgi:IBR domain, a half RING-finger domain
MIHNIMFASTHTVRCSFTNRECSKCGTKASIPKRQKTFFCPLGTCRFQSCRRCGEEAHPSIKCSEVEKQDVRNARTGVEEAMSQQLIRRCPNCHTPAILKGGCISMTCGRCRRSYCFRCRRERCSCSNSHAPAGDVTDRQAVRNAGESALRRSNNEAQRGLTGLVDQLL